MDNNAVGNRIKQRRKELKITQIQVKEATGISSGNLSDIENGKNSPSSTALIKLSELLQCSIDWILTGKLFTNIRETEEDEELLKYFHNISSKDKEELLMIAKMKYDYQRKEKLYLSPKDKIDHTA